MTTYTMRPISKSVFAITQGRSKVGFVRATSTGYVARIGEHCETAAIADAAFKAVAAKALGFATPQAVAQHNAEMRATKRAANAAFDNAINAATHGSDFAPLFDLLNRMK